MEQELASRTSQAFRSLKQVSPTLPELKHHSCAAVTLPCWIRPKVCKDAWAAMPIWAQLSWGPLWLFSVPLHPAIQPGNPILRAGLWSPAPPTSFLASHSALSHPVLGPLLRSTHPTCTQPACTLKDILSSVMNTSNHRWWLYLEPLLALQMMWLQQAEQGMHGNWQGQGKKAYRPFIFKEAEFPS